MGLYAPQDPYWGPEEQGDLITVNELPLSKGTKAVVILIFYSVIIFFL